MHTACQDCSLRNQWIDANYHNLKEIPQHTTETSSTTRGSPFGGLPSQKWSGEPHYCWGFNLFAKDGACNEGSPQIDFTVSAGKLATRSLTIETVRAPHGSRRNFSSGCRRHIRMGIARIMLRRSEHNPIPPRLTRIKTPAAGAG